MSEMVVSVCVITYNHCNYIRQCLDCILMQQVDFPIEIIINDDCSTDGTAEIVKEYEKNHPELFRATYQTENQYSKGVRGMFARFCFPKARGKYIALCEGDDYWTDPLKLQKQVDFLEKNSGYVMCSHECNSYIQSSGECFSCGFANGRDYSITNLINGEWAYQTLSVVFRGDQLNLSVLNKYEICVVLVIFYELLRNGGQGRQLKDIMGVYRIHDGGVWSLMDMNAKREQEFRVRMAIYKVAPNIDSAKMILSLWGKPISRIWLMRNFSIVIKCMLIFMKHFGLDMAIKVFYIKLILGRSLVI